jgi:hypothetical protein
MNRVELSNGISVVYGSDCQDSVVLEYPDGSRVQTTWTQLSHIERLIESLRQAYEVLLKEADSDSGIPVDALMRIDDLLYALRTPGRPSRARQGTH